MKGYKLRIGMFFENPDDDVLIMANDPELMAAAQAAAEADGKDFDQAAFDKTTGIKSMPFAVASITRNARFEASMVLTRDDLRRHIYEARAVLKIMDAAAELADAEMKGYRSGVRRTSGDED